MKRLNKILNYIEELENDSFAGWNKDQINAYLTACTSIKEKALELKLSEQIIIHKKKAIKFTVSSYVIYRDNLRQVVDKHFGNDELLWLAGAKGKSTKKSDLYQFYVDDKLIPMSNLLYRFFQHQFCETIDFLDIEEQQNSKTFTKKFINDHVKDAAVNRLFKLI